MNQKLLEQLALAKEAGAKAMAKDFFAPTPGSGGANETAPIGGEALAHGDDKQAPMDGSGGPEALTPEQLEELLALLGQQGGGAT